MSQKRHYIQVAVAGAAGTQDLFTYHAMHPVQVGGLVVVPFGKKERVGVIVDTVKKPDFNTRAVDKVLDLPPLPTQLIKLAKWLSKHYATPLSKVLQTVLPPQLSATPRSLKVPATDTQRPLGVSMFETTPAQKQALKEINQTAKPVLLHGATGSGKTQLYIELAKAAVKDGRSALVLVPEIALTPQMSEQFTSVFGDRVLLTHSSLTAAARRNIWLKILSNPEPQVVVGPRSALFMPFEDLGVVIIDECHEATYKQDQSPRYRATSAAAELAKMYGAKLVLGSATPTVEQMYLAHEGKLQLVELPQQIHTGERSYPLLVDLRDKTNFGSSRLLSRPLVAAMRDTLSRDRQSILFINRRGSARLTICQDCSWSATCPKCQIPLTFHADQGRLICHWCGYNQNPPATCPDCDSQRIVFIGSGTKSVEQEVAKLLPEARLARLDSDSLAAGNLKEVFSRMTNGKVDILIGTQLVAKGLDLPKVETVGVVLADQSLYLPDFTAAERTYQLIHQVSGRGGRAHGATSETIIQTYAPDHPVIKAAVSGNFSSFVSKELKERQQLGYPPFVFLLKLSGSYKTRSGAQRGGKKLIEHVLEHAAGNKSRIQVLGPAPSWQETLRGKYHWQVIIKSKDRDLLLDIASGIPSNWSADIDPINLL